MAEALLRTQGPGEEYRAAEARLLEPTGDQERGLLHLQARAALLRRRPEVAVDLAERLCRMDPEGEPLLAVAYRLAGRLEDSVRLATGAVLAGSPAGAGRAAAGLAEGAGPAAGLWRPAGRRHLAGGLGVEPSALRLRGGGPLLCPGPLTCEVEALRQLTALHEEMGLRPPRGGACRWQCQAEAPRIGVGCSPD